MSTPDSPASVAPGSRILPRLGWLVVLAGFAYFVAHNVPRYLVLTPESYGKYFWPRAGWLLPHVVGGLLAVILGPLQFWPAIRQKHLGFHRVAGRLYVVMIVAAAVAAFGLAFTIPPGDEAYASGLAGLSTAWLVTTGMAFVAIRRRNLVQHKQWMVRSYVVTGAFVTFRLVEKAMIAAAFLTDHERGGVLAWGCWAIPLLVTEVVLQAGAIFRAKA